MSVGSDSDSFRSSSVTPESCLDSTSMKEALQAPIEFKLPSYLTASHHCRNLLSTTPGASDLSGTRLPLNIVSHADRSNLISGLR